MIARLLLLGSIWNFCSEFIYRGLSPIFLAHTGAPTAVIVVLSSAAYGLEYGRLLQRVRNVGIGNIMAEYPVARS